MYNDKPTEEKNYIFNHPYHVVLAIQFLPVE